MSLDYDSERIAKEMYKLLDIELPNGWKTLLPIARWHWHKKERLNKFWSEKLIEEVNKVIERGAE